VRSVPTLRHMLSAGQEFRILGAQCGRKTACVCIYAAVVLCASLISLSFSLENADLRNGSACMEQYEKCIRDLSL
jgi:hypothetical protein